MCLVRRNLDPKARRFLAFGNLCLAVGLTLPYLGKGFGLGSQSQLDFLPEKHTDFIFATLAEDPLATAAWAAAVLRLSRRCSWLR